MYYFFKGVLIFLSIISIFILSLPYFVFAVFSSWGGNDNPLNKYIDIIETISFKLRNFTVKERTNVN